MVSKVIATFFIILVTFQAGQANLSPSFYAKSCPQLEKIVRNGVKCLTKKDPTTPAALLRLVFHDFEVLGVDASLLLDANHGIKESEVTLNDNFGIRKREDIGKLKSMVEAKCPEQVSCADLMVLAGREAVAISGGPSITVPLGRRDSSTPPNITEAKIKLIPDNINVTKSVSLFAIRKFTVEEHVAILGAHTLGNNHCFSLQSRLYNGLPPREPYAKTLQKICPKNSPKRNETQVPFDSTSKRFDNRYYKDIRAGRGVLVIDAEMAVKPITASIVQKFAQDQNAFFQAFSSAYVKMVSFQALTGNQGEIRKKCNVLN